MSPRRSLLLRGWINLKAAVTGTDGAAIITECERGDEVAVKHYEDALEKVRAPRSSRRVGPRSVKIGGGF